MKITAINYEYQRWQTATVALRWFADRRVTVVRRPSRHGGPPTVASRWSGPSRHGGPRRVLISPNGYGLVPITLWSILAASRQTNKAGRVTTTDMDATQGSEASASLLGPLNGKFIYKKNKDGTINKNVVICTICKREFSFHRSCTSLTYLFFYVLEFEFFIWGPLADTTLKCD